MTDSGITLCLCTEIGDRDGLAVTIVYTGKGLAKSITSVVHVATMRGFEICGLFKIEPGCVCDGIITVKAIFKHAEILL